METFAPTRLFVDDPRFAEARPRVLSELKPSMIDAPIRDLVARFNALPCCFTLQCCHGHFVYDGQPDRDNLTSLPDHDVGELEYRIAYLALVIEDSRDGERLRESLASVTEVDPDYVQFGSPEWFWNRHVNSYALQVEPVRFATLDRVVIGYREARHVETVRDAVFVEIARILDKN